MYYDTVFYFFSHSLVVYQFNILFNGDFEGARERLSGPKWNEEKRTHDATGHAEHFHHWNAIESLFSFFFFNFEGDQRCKNCQGPRVLSFDCLMPVSQSVMKKKEKESEESRNEEWHPLPKGG
jgi:hypothetical protein